MRKYFIILTFIIYTLGFNTSFADSGCKVKSGPSKGLSEYFQDIQGILSSLQGKISGAQGCGQNGTGALDNITGNSKKGYNVIVKDINKGLNFDGYLSSWEFNLFPLFNGAVPQEFYRDHDYLSSRSDKINKMTIQAAKKCALDIPTDFSTDIQAKADKYNLDTTSVNSTLSSLRVLNDEATVFFRCTVVGSMGGCNMSNEVLNKEISGSYGAEAKDVCNKDNQSFEQIVEQIKKITSKPSGFQAMQKGIDEWKAAIKLLGQVLGGKSDSTYEAKEKALLSKELQRQGIRGNQASAIMNNLECMNDGEVTLSVCISKSIGGLIEPFTNAYNDIATNITKNSPDTKSIPRQTASLKSMDYIVKDIKNDHDNLFALMSGENKGLEKGLATLIQLHQNLSKTNQILEENLKTTQQLCNKQGSGEGVCQ